MRIVKSVCENDSIKTVLSSSLLSSCILKISSSVLFSGVFGLFCCKKNYSVTLLCCMDFCHGIWSRLACPRVDCGKMMVYIQEERV
jgi:hypothetical protein